VFVGRTQDDVLDQAQSTLGIAPAPAADRARVAHHRPVDRGGGGPHRRRPILQLGQPELALEQHRTGRRQDDRFTQNPPTIVMVQTPLRRRGRNGAGHHRPRPSQALVTPPEGDGQAVERPLSVFGPPGVGQLPAKREGISGERRVGQVCGRERGVQGLQRIQLRAQSQDGLVQPRMGAFGLLPGPGGIVEPAGRQRGDHRSQQQRQDKGRRQPPGGPSAPSGGQPTGQQDAGAHDHAQRDRQALA